MGGVDSTARVNKTIRYEGLDINRPAHATVSLVLLVSLMFQME